LDVVTQEILIGHVGELEKSQWFLRAHLETVGGFISRRPGLKAVAASQPYKRSAGRMSFSLH
jgi:starvation-inducible DNA-binding protein